ncbi:hypothetical protein QO000_002482 [Alkalihalobacillus hemicentroti]|uniref:Uncharacterized protein n=1 Tax=Guptibacillus hwajinpoensis TaxID=208199 RepID=A0ABU0K2C7_9BACL|nr:hypothetical protein [Alkalihalobacillus hemicentroti]
MSFIMDVLYGVGIVFLLIVGLYFVDLFRKK